MSMRKIDSWGRPVRFKHSYNLEVFQTKNELFYYLLGAFITDGNVYFYRKKQSAKTSLASKDIDWLRLINQKICDTDLVSTTKKGHGVLGIYDPAIANILSNNGCRPRKSLTVKLPEIPEEYLRDFLRGCMDGDGSISHRTSKAKRTYGTYYYKVSSCYICSASKKFLLQISKRLNSLGFKHYFIVLKPKPRMLRLETITSTKPMYRLLFNNKDCKNFLEWIYYTNHTISMPRKLGLFKQVCSQHEP